MQAYTKPARESDPYALPDLEVFYMSARDIAGVVADNRLTESEAEDGELNPYVGGPGFYYWPCFPGCLPDGDPVGPFATSEEALADARDGFDDDEVAQ